MSSSSSSDDEDEASNEAAEIGLHLVLLMRHLLIKSHLVSQSQGHGTVPAMQFANKCTQTEDVWPHPPQMQSEQACCIVRQQQATYTWNEMRSAVNNERAKSRLRVEISALKERCEMLERMCTNQGVLVPSKS